MVLSPRHYMYIFCQIKLFFNFVQQFSLKLAPTAVMKKRKFNQVSVNEQIWRTISPLTTFDKHNAQKLQTNMLFPKTFVLFITVQYSCIFLGNMTASSSQKIHQFADFFVYTYLKYPKEKYLRGTLLDLFLAGICKAANSLFLPAAY